MNASWWYCGRLVRIVYGLLLPFVILLAGCAGRAINKDELFEPETPFSRRIPISGDIVCWSVKRAFLSQGYLLDRSSDSVIMAGTKDSQPDEKTNITLRLQTTCVDNKNGSSTVFATANRETSKLQSVMTSFSAGVGIATVTLPSGTDRVLRVISRETIKDLKFYERFYQLVRSLAEEERRLSAAEVRDREGRAMERRHGKLD